MGEYKAPVRVVVENRSFIFKALFELGLNCPDVARLCHVGEAMVRRDYTSHGGATAFPDTANPSTNERRARAFANCLCRAYKLGILGGYRAGLDERGPGLNTLRRILAMYLDVDHIFAVVEAIAASVEVQMFPSDPLQYQGYRKLLEKLVAPPPKVSSELMLAKFWHMTVAQNRNIPTRDDFAAALARWAYQEYGKYFRMPIDSSAVECIARALADLDPDADLLMRMRYGLGSRDGTLPPTGIITSQRDCGALLPGHPTGSAVDQREERIYRRLRRKTFEDRLFWVIAAPEIAVVAHRTKRFVPFGGRSISSHSDFGIDIDEVLLMDVAYVHDRLDLSASRQHIFKDAHMKTIGDLVGYTPGQLKQLGGFGLAIIAQIENILRIDFGISLRCRYCKTFHIFQPGTVPNRHQDGTLIELKPTASNPPSGTT